MARVTKRRKICLVPKATLFQPSGVDATVNLMTLDELEALRLADVEEMDQDTAAACMEVSRATFQRILHSAHRVVAMSLVQGQAIEIKGGKYVVADNRCDGEKSCQGCRFEAEHQQDK